MFLGFLSVASRVDSVAALLELDAQQRAHSAAVIDEENLLGRLSSREIIP